MFVSIAAAAGWHALDESAEFMFVYIAATARYQYHTLADLAEFMFVSTAATTVYHALADSAQFMFVYISLPHLCVMHLLIQRTSCLTILLPQKTKKEG
jgi:hypothetical protein